LVVGAGLLLGRALIGGLVDACTWASWQLIDAGLGGSQTLATTWTKFLAAVGATGAVVGGPEGSLAAAALMALGTALLAATVWLELAVRAALLYLLATLLPLALVGLYWRRLTTWLVRIAEVIVAVALSQVVITATLVLGTALLDHSLSLNSAQSAPGADLSAVVSGLALLLLGSLGLPITLRVVPMAVDAAAHAGVGARFGAGAAGQLASLGSAGAGGLAGLAGAPVRAMRGFQIANGAGGAKAMAAAADLRGARDSAAPARLLADSAAARFGARVAGGTTTATPSGESK
jgi:hypothetical protein